MPLLFDLPLDQLLKYQGVNPRPDDFDAFWDSALAEMHAMDSAVKLEPASFQANGCECFDLTFTGIGGARIHAKFIRPSQVAGPHPAVLRFHGYSGNAGSWSSLLPYVATGYSIAALDCRGQSGQSEDSGSVTGNTFRGHIIRGLADEDPKKLLFHQIFMDTAQLARIVMDMPEVDADRVGAFGGSQGGGLTLACAALEPKIKRAAPLFPFLCDYRRVWDLDLDKDAYQELRDYFRYYDPQHQHEDEIFRRLGYIDLQFLAPRIQAEIMMGTGLMDTICPPSSQFAAYNKIPGTKSLRIYPDFGHESIPVHEDATFTFLQGL